MDHTDLFRGEKSSKAQETSSGQSRRCIYINGETHRILTSLVRKIVEGGKEMNVGAFADMIISEFLQKNKQAINDLYRKDRGDLF